jgi:adenylate cyclase
MALEIERKFIVKTDLWNPETAGTKYMQGYLSEDPDRTVRVRIAGDKGYLTIKGRSHGASRLEFEYVIPVEDARQLLEQIAHRPMIDKTRYLHKVGNHIWEIDIFAGDNEGLVVAEIELKSEDETFVMPNWAGLEVTEDHRYKNSNLAKRPFKTW